MPNIEIKSDVLSFEEWFVSFREKYKEIHNIVLDPSDPEDYWGAYFDAGYSVDEAIEDDNS